MAKNQKTQATENGKAEPAKKKKADKNKKPNIFVRMGRKIREVFSELKKVSWPSFSKIVKSTGVVIMVVLIFIVVVTAADAGLMWLLDLITDLGV